MQLPPLTRPKSARRARRLRGLTSWPFVLVALPLASCLVPTFDLQPDDGGPDGGFGGDSSGGAGSGSGGEASDSGGAVGDGGNTSGGASSGGNDPGAGGADTGGTDSGGTSGGGTQNGSGGAESSGGTSGSGGGPDVDANGKENALPGSTLSAPGDYLRMGELRLVPDRTGSDSIDCGTAISVFTETEPSVSWTFDRPSNCGSTGAPDFPHVEFGVQPYGLEPRDFSSTSLLPTFIQDISSLSVDIQGLAANFQSSSDWTLELTFWLNMANPEVSSDPLVYVEVSVLFAWQNARWPSSPGAEGSGDVGTPPGSVASGGESYTLWVKRDDWNGHIFYEFRHDAGPLNPFSGLVDLREFLDYLADDGIGGTVWLTDIQVGGEFDNGTSGEVTLSDITFEVNGEERSPDFK